MAKKKSFTIGGLGLFGALLLSVSALLLTFVASNYRPSSKSQAGVNITGSGAPNGPHFNLNIIGVPKGKTADMSGGSRIFVPLVGNAKIMLTEGETFHVLDANGTDGQARFQMPNPDPDNDGYTKYSVWVRPLGKPGGKSTTTTCATDPLDGSEWCSVYNMVMVRESGGSKFTDVSKQLLYIYADINLDGTLERYPLFDQRLQDYLWNYDNQGMKLMQMRFYEVVSNVN